MQDWSTSTVIVAVSQFVGFNISQIVYSNVYVPAGVPASTSTVPSTFSTTCVVGLLDPSRNDTGVVTSTPPTESLHFRKVRRKAVQRVVIFNNIAQARTARVSVHRTVTVVLGYNRCGFHLNRDHRCITVRRVQFLTDRVVERVRARRCTRRHSPLP